MTRTQTRGGFALPMALLVMMVLTAGIAAGFYATSAETITNAAERGENSAYNIAVAGLEQFLSLRNSSGFCTNSAYSPESCLADPTAPAADSEWARMPANLGYADVKAVLVRKYVTDSQPALFFVRSVGVDTSKSALTASTSSVHPMRAVGVYATWTTAVVNVEGAWFALDGLTKNGNSGSIDGHDQCAADSGGGKTTVAGAVVPGGGQFSGSTGAFTGSPALDTTKSFATLQASDKLDWAGIIGGSIPADYTVPPNAFPSATWFSNNPNSWPIIRIHSNNYTLPNQGRGMIIADSNFTISGSNMWDGVVLIGGSLTSNGNNTTAGATLSGLNYLLPGAAAPICDANHPQYCSSDNSTANGQKTYVYNSCKVAKASQGLRSYKVLTNTWLDVVPVW